MKQRITELLALFLVGDGILSAVDPKRHCLLWEIGPESCRHAMDEFARHPAVTRVVGAVEAIAGVWLASRQEPELSTKIAHPRVALA
jgi:hypothetical protein